MHNPAKEAYVTPTGKVFITKDNVYIQATIVIAVNILGKNIVNPLATFAKLFEAVPNITAIIKIT